MLFWMRFGRVWGTVFGAFWAILAGFWALKRRPILKPKLEAEKVILETREGLWPSKELQFRMPSKLDYFPLN